MAAARSATPRPVAERPAAGALQICEPCTGCDESSSHRLVARPGPCSTAVTNATCSPQAVASLAVGNDPPCVRSRRLRTGSRPGNACAGRCRCPGCRDSRAAQRRPDAADRAGGGRDHRAALRRAHAPGSHRPDLGPGHDRRQGPVPPGPRHRCQPLRDHSTHRSGAWNLNPWADDQGHGLYRLGGGAQRHGRAHASGRHRHLALHTAHRAGRVRWRGRRTRLRDPV